MRYKDLMDFTVRLRGALCRRGCYYDVAERLTEPDEIILRFGSTVPSGHLWPAPISVLDQADGYGGVHRSVIFWLADPIWLPITSWANASPSALAKEIYVQLIAADRVYRGLRPRWRPYHRFRRVVRPSPLPGEGEFNL